MLTSRYVQIPAWTCVTKGVLALIRGVSKTDLQLISSGLIVKSATRRIMLVPTTLRALGRPCHLLRSENTYKIPQRKMAVSASLFFRFKWRCQIMGSGMHRMNRSPTKDRKPLEKPMVVSEFFTQWPC